MESKNRKQNMTRALAMVVNQVRVDMKKADSRIKQLEAKRLDLASQLDLEMSDSEREEKQKEHFILQEKINLQQEIVAEGQKALIENGLQTKEDLQYNY